MGFATKRTADSDGNAGPKRKKFEKKPWPTNDRRPNMGKSCRNSGITTQNSGPPDGKTAAPNDENKFQNKFRKTNDGNAFKKPDFSKKSKPDFSQKSTPATAPEKMDWKKFKSDKKELKLKRRGNKDLFELTTQAKKIYEDLKCKSTKNRDELCRQLHALLRGGDHYQKLVMAHDTARVVQCMLKHSSAEIRREISESLIPVVSKMATTRYAHFCVSRMIKYGTPDIKQKVIEAIFGNIVNMINQAQSSSIVDTIYVSWANSLQKAYMRQELYGDLYKMSKDNQVKCIADTYKDSPHMKLAILNAIKTNLNRVVNKKLVDNSLVHTVLLDYLNECNDEDKTEIITAFSPFIPSLASTKDGVHASMLCFWNSIVKDRRAIVKTLREHLTKLCTHEQGHVLILAIVNSMDDTKALKKAIFDHIFAEIETIVSVEWGRKIIDWFVAPADTALFHPQTVAFLEEGLKFSKKDKETRRAELLEAVEDSLCKAIADNPYFWLRGGHTALTTVAILKYCKGQNLKNALDAVADVVCDVSWVVPAKESTEDNAEANGDKKASVGDGKNSKKKKIVKHFEGCEDDDDNDDDTKPKLMESVELVPGIEHAGLHIALKKLLKLKRTDDAHRFSSSLAEKLTDEVIEKWLPLNRASFVLLNTYENGGAAEQQQIKELLEKNKTLLKSQKHAASKLLIKNLDL